MSSSVAVPVPTTTAIDSVPAPVQVLATASTMSLRRPINVMGLGAGAAFGVLLVLSGFSDPVIVHRMLLLQDRTLYLMFAALMATALPLLWLLDRLRWRTPLGGPIELERVPVERRHILGALTFGCGWAVAGTCPGPMLAMTVGGHVLGAVVMAGLVGGQHLRELVKRPAREEPIGPWEDVTTRSAS